MQTREEVRVLCIQLHSKIVSATVYSPSVILFVYYGEVRVATMVGMSGAGIDRAL